VKPWHPFAENVIRLHIENRITLADAQRQERTAREILRRLAHQPGLVLADEVGMGKTFVALAVAASVSLSDTRRRPVVVMVPPTLKEKWPQDFATFLENCPGAANRLRAASAESAVEFLKLLDDPIERRNSIIFLTHGAMHRGLSDGWVKLAVIQRALKGRHHTAPLKRALSRCLGSLLWGMGWLDAGGEEIWLRLLDTPASDWLWLLHRHGLGVHGRHVSETDDEPVPEAVIHALKDFDTTETLAALQEIPQRQSANYEARVKNVRRVLTDRLKEVWRRCLTDGVKFKLPLLVMDEAHHLKNPDARLSGLFHLPDARADADEVSRGALGGVFERMLFLTATPFQLGHHELCSVLERFDGIAWHASAAPPGGRDEFRQQVGALRERLDAAQQSALNLDAAWGVLRASDLAADGKQFESAEAWWAACQSAATFTATGERVRFSYTRTFERMRAAEESLRPWVIRHLKPREHEGRPRREQLPGASILDDTNGSEAGLGISGPALLPFLLAARATVCAPDSRPVFAEGLASSYEAFRNTRQTNECRDGDDDPADVIGDDALGEWYLRQLELALPSNDHNASASHPKVAATARRVIEAWQRGEKVLVFCHYIATGRVLRQVISNLMQENITELGAKKLGCSHGEVASHLERFGNRFSRAPAREACDAEVMELLAAYPAGDASRTVAGDCSPLRADALLSRTVLPA